MTIETIISTMHQNDYALLERMNICTDAIVINQCDKNSFIVFDYRGHLIKWVSTTDRGIGKSRNLGIIYSSADILLFADDDIVYVDNYPDLVLNAFSDSKIDMVMFNLVSQNPDRPEILTKKDYKLKWTNCLKFGAFRIAIKRKTIEKNNVFFSLLFGGGSKYQNGEDNIFITHNLFKGAYGLASSLTIGTVEQKQSTWFKGYDETYYHDRGALMTALYGRKSLFIIPLYEVLKSRNKKIPLFRRIKLEFIGRKDFLKHNKN